MRRFWLPEMAGKREGKNSSEIEVQASIFHRAAYKSDSIYIGSEFF
jgi:hypothetical protein